MKWIFYGAGIVLLTALGLAGYSKLRRNTQRGHIEGGIVTNDNGADAPKVIESSEITEFRCEISLISAWDPGEFGHRVYKLNARRENGTVHCIYAWSDRSDSDKVTFETDISFLETLQKLVSEYNLAKHNGFCHSVSGLPAMYGDLLDIQYASGEAIYASDNQSGFLSSHVSAEFITLFAEASGKIPGLLPVTVSKEAVIERECSRPIRTAYPVITLSEEHGKRNLLLRNALVSYNDILREEYQLKLFRLRQAAQTGDGSFPELYAENKLYVTRNDSQIFSFYEKREETGEAGILYSWSAHTFNTSTGKELRFEDAFEITDALYEMLAIEFEDAAPAHTLTEDMHERIAQAVRDNNTAVVCFALSHSCAHVFLTDSRFPSQHITLSFKDYPDFFKPEWKTAPYRQMIRLDWNIDYPLTNGSSFRMEFAAENNEWRFCVKDFFGKKQEYRETFCSAPFDVYLIRKNGRQLLYLDVPNGSVSEKTNVYNIAKNGLSFLGQTDCVMCEKVSLDPDRLLMMRFDKSGGLPVPVYGICRVGDDGMPVWLEPVE